MVCCVEGGLLIDILSVNSLECQSPEEFKVQGEGDYLSEMSRELILFDCAPEWTIEQRAFCVPFTRISTITIQRFLLRHYCLCWISFNYNGSS